MNGERSTVNSEQIISKVLSKHPHRNLEAWKHSMDLVEDIYSITKAFPKEETYGLSSQMRRAAVSVPSNLAEGAAAMTNKQFISFLGLSLGSLSELDTQTEIAYRLQYLQKETYTSINDQIDKCKSLVFGLQRSVIKKISNTKR